MTNKEILKVMERNNYTGDIESFIEYCHHNKVNSSTLFAITIVSDNLVVSVNELFLIQNMIYFAQINGDFTHHLRDDVKELLRLFSDFGSYGINNILVLCEPFSTLVSVLEEAGFNVSDCEDIEMPATRKNSKIPMKKAIMSIAELKNKHQQYKNA